MKDAARTTRSGKQPILVKQPEGRSNPKGNNAERTQQKKQKPVDTDAVVVRSSKEKSAVLDEREPHDLAIPPGDEVELPFLDVPPIIEVPMDGQSKSRQETLPVVNDRSQPAFKNVAPVQDRSIKETILDRVLDAPVEMTIGELMGGREIPCSIHSAMDSSQTPADSTGLRWSPA